MDEIVNKLKKSFKYLKIRVELLFHDVNKHEKELKKLSEIINVQNEEAKEERENIVRQATRDRFEAFRRHRLLEESVNRMNNNLETLFRAHVNILQQQTVNRTVENEFDDEVKDQE